MQSLVYQDGNLVSGSLEALIKHMVPTSEYYPDKSYLFAFLLSARLFIRPHNLLEKVCNLCETQQELSAPHRNTNIRRESTTSQQQLQQSAHLQKFSINFIQLLGEWIETFPYDFRDERLMKHVRVMTQKCIQINCQVSKDVSAMLQQLLNRLSALDQHEEHLGRLNQIIEAWSDDGTNSSSSGITIQSLSSSSSSSSSSNNNIALNTLTPRSRPNGWPPVCEHYSEITGICSSPTELAEQLTHIELERLSHIGPEEFVEAFAKGSPHLEQSFNDMKKTRNLESYVQWFNRLSYLVATEIVMQTKKKQRVRIVEYWIETARECFNIGNFNSLMAIIAGLNMSPITRLKVTWAKVSSAKFAVLENQMDPSSNFNSYRSTLKAAMWRSAGATDDRQHIVIPFFSLLVKDLYFLNEGCSNKYVSIS